MWIYIGHAWLRLLQINIIRIYSMYIYVHESNNNRCTSLQLAFQLNWALPRQLMLSLPDLLAVNPPAGSSTSAFS